MDIVMNYLCDSLRKSFKLGMMVHAGTLVFGRLRVDSLRPAWPPSKIVSKKKKGTSIATVDKGIAAA